MAQAKPTVQAHKNQASRLAQYLGTLGHAVTRTQSLEALSRALHGKPWNTVQAELKNSAPANKAQTATTPDTGPTYLYHVNKAGQAVMFSVVGQFRRGALEMGSNLNASIQALSDDLVTSLIEDDATRWPEVFSLFEAHNGPYFRGGSAQDTALRFAVQFGDGFGTWLKAFRPHLYWSYLARRLFGSVDAASHSALGRFEVAEDVDQPGLWVYFHAGEGCDYSYDSRLEAELALCEQVEANLDLQAQYEPLARLATVRAASGTVEQSGVPPRFAGRHDESTGRTLFLRGDPLTAQHLSRLTNEGEFSIDIAVPVNLWDMASNGLEWLNDHVSELITGSICDLESLDYSRGEPGDDAPELAPTEVWVRVVAHWAPMND